MQKQFFTYILASKRNGTLYVGISSDLVQRIYQHREGLLPGFTRDYGVHRLVYYEVHSTAESATTREKHIKAWKRNWKLELIEGFNPDWDDLYPSII